MPHFYNNLMRYRYCVLWLLMNLTFHAVMSQIQSTSFEYRLDHQNSSTYHPSSWRTVHQILDARGCVNWAGAAITIWRLMAIDQSNRFNYGRSHYNMAFYYQWPIKSFTEISVSLAFASIFLLTIRPDVRLGVKGR